MSSDKPGGVDDIATSPLAIASPTNDELQAELRAVKGELATLKAWAIEADKAFGHIARFMTAHAPPAPDPSDDTSGP